MDIHEEIERHAIEGYPDECVGYIYDGEYHRLCNVSKYPTERYQLSIEDKIMLNGKRGLQGLVHSHTVLDNSPSKRDLEAQSSTAFHFYIIGTDGRSTTDIREILYEKPHKA